MFWVFGCEAHGILSPRTGIEPAPPALEGKILTTGLPLKSTLLLFIHNKTYWQCLSLMYIVLYLLKWTSWERGDIRENCFCGEDTVLKEEKSCQEDRRRTFAHPRGTHCRTNPHAGCGCRTDLGSPIAGLDSLAHMMPAPRHHPPGLAIQGMKPVSPWYAALGRGQGQREENTQGGGGLIKERLGGTHT